VRISARQRRLNWRHARKQLFLRPTIVEQRRQYTSKAFAALGAYVQRLDPAVIAQTYYSTDEDVQASTPGAMERYLRVMLDSLVKLTSSMAPLFLPTT